MGKVDVAEMIFCGDINDAGHRAIEKIVFGFERLSSRGEILRKRERGSNVGCSWQGQDVGREKKRRDAGREKELDG